jgi:hypothetical protein
MLFFLFLYSYLLIVLVECRFGIIFVCHLLSEIICYCCRKEKQYFVVKKHGEVKRKRGKNVLSAYDGGSGSGHRPQSGGSYHSFWQVRNYILGFFARRGFKGSTGQIRSTQELNLWIAHV